MQPVEERESSLAQQRIMVENFGRVLNVNEQWVRIGAVDYWATVNPLTNHYRVTIDRLDDFTKTDKEEFATQECREVVLKLFFTV